MQIETAMPNAAQLEICRAETAGKRIPNWLVILMPSIADVLFLCLFAALGFGPMSRLLLGDADTGWHIRTGEQILRTFSVPRVDTFSFTMPGHPWYAWEWLYDTVVSVVHSRLGLTGIVAFSALLAAFTFAALYRFLLIRSGNVLIAALLTAMSAACSSIHLLARPHLITWVLTLLWLVVLETAQSGKRRKLLWLPVLTVFWVNMHGGFLLGPVLLALYMVANAWEWFTASDQNGRRTARENLRWLTMTMSGSVLATFANPYGYKLHAHVYHYLGNRFLMDHILEFLSPNFHDAAVKVFEILLLLSIVCVTLWARRIRAIDLLLVLFSAHIALYSARNIPIAAILLSATIAPLLADVFRSGERWLRLPASIRQMFASIERFSTRMMNMELRFDRHALPALVSAIALAALFSGSNGVRTKFAIRQFDEHRYPVKAAEFLATNRVGEVFTSDAWGAYIIYRLHPQTRVFIDDRHDFYGEAFLRDYFRILNVTLGWQAVLDRHKVNWVLVSPDSALASTLKETPAWKVAYDDGVAILFSRGDPLMGASRPAR